MIGNMLTLIRKQHFFFKFLLALLCEKYILFRSHVDYQNTVDVVCTKCKFSANMLTPFENEYL